MRKALSLEGWVQQHNEEQLHNQQLCHDCREELSSSFPLGYQHFFKPEES
jgi:hypothetical protein